MEKQRITYLDMAKGIGIILVVIGHYPKTGDQAMKWITSFHMPLFFIVSGMLIYYKNEIQQDFKTTVIKKAKSIMIPYLSFSILYMAINVLYYFYDKTAMPLEHIGLIGYRTITLYGHSVLWFLPALFLSEIIFIEIRRKMNHKNTISIVLIMGAVGVLGKIAVLSDKWGLNEIIKDVITVILRLGIPIVLLMIGYYIMSFMKNSEKTNWKEVLIGIFALGINIAIAFYNGVVDINFMVFNNPLLFILGAVTGTMAVVLLCKNIKIGKLDKGFIYLGKNSLIIMATHLDFYVMLVAINTSLWFNHNYVTRAKDYVHYLTMAVLIVAIEIVIIFIFNHFLAFLLGKKKTKA